MGNDLQIFNGAVLSNAGAITVDNSNSYVTLSGGTLNASSVLLNNATTSLTIGNNGSTNGTIIARASGNLISGSGSVTLAGNAGIDAATFGVTNTANMTGAGALTVNGNGGTGTLTLSGSNSYTGGTILSAGRLTLANSNALGTNTLTLNGGTLDEILPSDLTISNDLALDSFTYAGSGNLIQTNGGCTLQGASTVTVQLQRPDPRWQHRRQFRPDQGQATAP